MCREPLTTCCYAVLLGMIVAFASVVGCARIAPLDIAPISEEQPAPKPTPANQKPPGDRKIGTLVLIPGVIGQCEQLDGTCDALREAGVKYNLEIIDWGTSPFQPIENLTNLKANIRRAERIAARLTELRRQRPDQPLVLLGKSGGGGLAVMAVERLPEDVKIDRLILIATAISQQYDLAKVRAHCKDKVICFYSPVDGIVAWGTLLFGTIDRHNAISVGHSGFVDRAGRLRHEDKLEQISWEPSWILAGHHGGHTGYRGRQWIKQYLAGCIDPALADSHHAG